jgi:hypothetical protein
MLDEDEGEAALDGAETVCIEILILLLFPVFVVGGRGDIDRQSRMLDVHSRHAVYPVGV